MEVKCKYLEHFDRTWGGPPRYQTPQAAGADIRACLGPGETMLVKPGERVLIPTGLVFEIPKGYEIQVRPRSGLSYKTGFMVVNSPGTIDSDYRGEVKILLGNLGLREEVVAHGDRVAQLVLAPVIQALYQEQEDGLLSATQRGEGGLGSTGVC